MTFAERRRETAVGLVRSLASPLACAAVVALGATVVVLERSVAAVEDSAVVRSEVLALAARLAAESAASAFVATGGAAVEHRYDTGDGLVVRTRVAPTAEPDELHLAAVVGEQRFDFGFRRLEGGNPRSLGRAFTVATGAAVPPEWLEVNDSVREPAPELETAVSVDADQLAACGVVQDGGIALEHLPAGTDAEDFVLGAGRSAACPKPPENGVLHVQGNLWLDGGGPTLELQLRRDLTLVVHGNVYLGRGIRVRGPGLLTLAAASDAGCAILDRDGNGRFGPGDEVVGGAPFHGPIEGCGNVYVGLARGGTERIELQNGLIVQGVLHLHVDQARVHGPVVVAGAGIRLGPCEGRLLCTGLRLPNLRSEALPGFAVVGSPRPSPLKPLQQEPLYAATPPR